MQFNKNRHAVFKLTYHLVVATKYRHPCITPDILNRIKVIATGLFTDWNCTLIEINGGEDHVYLLFDAPPQIQLSKIINSFKTVTSRYIRKELSEHLAKYYWKPYFWSNSYMVFTTGGATLEVVKKYIENQGKKP